VQGRLYVLSENKKIKESVMVNFRLSPDPSFNNADIVTENTIRVFQEQAAMKLRKQKEEYEQLLTKVTANLEIKDALIKELARLAAVKLIEVPDASNKRPAVPSF